MRVLWVCNIMLPAIAKELGAAYSVREGWLSGILGRILEAGGPGGDSAGGGVGADDRTGAGGDSLQLGICFPDQGSFADFSGRLRLGSHQREVACYGFYEDLTREEADEPSLEPRFARILADFQPDLVHIFGTEFGHAYACAKAWNRSERTLVGLQGLCTAIAEDYMADLPQRVQQGCTLRDFLKKDSLRDQQRKYAQRGERERKLLCLAGHVTGRTLFDKTISSRINPKLTYHFMNETMRDSFYEGSWTPAGCRRHEIFVSQADYPLKGFHYLLQAMKEILQEAPDATIAVAGNSVLGVDGILSRIKIPAYGKYLRSLIRENGLEGRIRVLGRMEEAQMKQAYLSCHVFLCPSAVENSPNSVAEAQLLGTPVAASRAGGIPSVVEDGVSGLLFEKGNAHDLARAVLQIFSSDELACRLSEQERRLAAQTYDGGENYRRLLQIYGDILG